MYDTDMTERALRDWCNMDRYPPRFDIHVSGEEGSPKDRATFKFTGCTRKIQSQIILKSCTGNIATV